MKTKTLILFPILALAAIILSGCATNEGYEDEKEYSDLPWNQQQQWEGSPSMPGFSSGGRY